MEFLTSCLSKFCLIYGIWLFCHDNLCAYKRVRMDVASERNWKGEGGGRGKYCQPKNFYIFSIRLHVAIFNEPITARAKNKRYS